MYRVPSDAGTFMNWRRIPVGELEPGMVAVGGVPMDLTGEALGQRFGAEAVRKASRFLHRYLVADPAPLGVVNVSTGEPIYIGDRPSFVDVGDAPIYDAQLERSATAISEWMRDIVTAGAFPLMLAGDHWTTYPLIRGYHDARAAMGDQRLGYIQLDAHLDLESHEQYGADWWGSEALLVAGLEGIDPRNMVFFGTSGEVWRTEWDWVREHGATIIPSDEVRADPDAAAAKALEIAGEGTDSIYLTVDIDAIDVTESAGTSLGATFWGISARDFVRALELFGRSDRIGAVDVVEVVPDFDPHGSTAWLVARGLIGFLQRFCRDATVAVGAPAEGVGGA